MTDQSAPVNDLQPWQLLGVTTQLGGSPEYLQLVDTAQELLATTPHWLLVADEIMQKAKLDGQLDHYFESVHVLASAVWLRALQDHQVHTIQLLQSVTVKDGVYEIDFKAGVRAIIESYLGWHQIKEPMARAMRSPGLPARHHLVRDARNQLNGPYMAVIGEFLKAGVKAQAIGRLSFGQVHAVLAGPADDLCRSWFSGLEKNDPLDSLDLLTEAAWVSLKA